MDIELDFPTLSDSQDAPASLATHRLSLEVSGTESVLFSRTSRSVDVGCRGVYSHLKQQGCDDLIYLFTFSVLLLITEVVCLCSVTQDEDCSGTPVKIQKTQTNAEPGMV